MNYEQAMAYWFAHANYEQRTPGAADLTLERMLALLRRLGDPQRRLRILHVAGSKGKGSVSAMLAAILTRAGYRAGLFTSPHLVNIEERFQVNGYPITRAELADLLMDVRTAVEAEPMVNGPPTFFEIATAVGFLHFLRRRVEAAVMEVGLGGRLDSTNVCLPVLSVITSISHDHTRILGDKLSQIAREKAGIIKKGRPVVSGVVAPGAREVIEAVCNERFAPLSQLEEDFSFTYRPGKVRETGISRARVTVTTRSLPWPELEVNLLGQHQAANTAVVLACVEELRRFGWTIGDDAVSDGLRDVDWPARLEVMARRPYIVLDCAHNVASAQAVVDTLNESFPPGGRVLLFAGSNDKDLAGMFRVLAPHFRDVLFTRFTNNPRATPPEQLATLWAETCPTAQAKTQIVESSSEALAEARRITRADELLCITGSVFLAGELRPLLK